MTGNDLAALVAEYQSVTPGTPMNNRRRNNLYNDISEILVQNCAVRVQNETDASAFTDTMRSVLKNYSADQGEFLHYFRKTYSKRKMSCYSKQYFVKSHIRTQRADIGVYDAPMDGAKQLRLLKPKQDYYVYAAIPDYKNPEYFKLRLSIPNDTQKTRTVYVKYEYGVEYYCYDTESMTYVDKDGNVVERETTDRDTDRSKARLSRELVQLGLHRNLLIFLKFHEKKTKDGKNPAQQGKLTKYDCFRMFFTEDMIAILQNGDDRFRPETADNETMSMNLCDRRWMGYLLTEPCRSFHQIIRTPRHTYDYFLHNGKENPIMIPPILPIRGKYVREEMGVNRTDISMKPDISKNRKEYKAMYGMLNSEERIRT